jgi:HlyD family secretion protein
VLVDDGDHVKAGQVLARITRAQAPPTLPVSATVDTMTQMGRARVELDKNVKLRAGMFASARVNTGTSCNPGVPLSAVLYGSDSAVVQVVRDSRIETRPVTVGIIAGENAEILEGLSEGDEVVVRAGSFLREDDLVRPVQLRPASSGEAQ